MQLDATREGEEGVAGWQERSDRNRWETAARWAGPQLPRPGRLSFHACHNGGMSRKSGFYIYTALHHAAYPDNRPGPPLRSEHAHAGTTWGARRDVH